MLKNNIMLTCVLIFALICVVESLPAKVFFDPPWGKDAELVYSKKPRNQAVQAEEVIPEKSVGVKFGEIAIAFHQNVISPADGPRSHFKPSSSQYTLDAMRKYGFFKGWTMGADRLMRENGEEWVYKSVKAEGDKNYKYDPVR